MELEWREIFLIPILPVGIVKPEFIDKAKTLLPNQFTGEEFVVSCLTLFRQGEEGKSIVVLKAFNLQD